MKNFYSFMWPRVSTRTFSAGSSVNYLADGQVEFSNVLLSPSDTIYSWESAAGMPQLRPGGTYVFGCDAAVEPEGSVGIEFEFLDQFGKRLDHLVFSTLQDSFTVPDETFTFTLKLMNMNQQRIVFKALWLGEQALF